MIGRLVMESDDALKFIRKLQKKLRQIERLEQSPKELSNEEEVKVNQKLSLRQKLQEVLTVLKTANISLESDLQNTSIEDEYDNKPETSNCNESKQNSNHDEDMIEYEQHEPDVIKGNVRCISPTSPTSEAKRVKLDEEPPILKPIETESAATTDSEIPAEVPTESQKRNAAGDSKTSGKTRPKKKTKSLQSKLRKNWRTMKFSVQKLEGHNYTVTSVDACNTWVASGSKDTSVKLWNLNTGDELRNMTGHTGGVTCVRLIPRIQSSYIRNHIECSNPEHNIDVSDTKYANDTFLLSGSTDCAIRYWLIPTGLCIKSLYTYSPVATFTVLHDVQFIFVCSDTGKLIVYDLITGESVMDKKIHNDYVKSVDIKHNKLATASLDGEFKIWEVSACAGKFENDQGRFIRDVECSLKLIYVLENDEMCPIYTNLLHGNLLYYGTEGANLRVYDTVTGSNNIRKIRNHSMNFGFTDSLSIIDDVILSSSYDLNTGQGSINIRSLNQQCFEVYLATLQHNFVTRIIAMTTINIDSLKHIVVAGENLVLFKQIQDVENLPIVELISPQVFTNLRKEVVDSDIESDTTDGSEVQSSWFWKKTEKSVVENTDKTDGSSSDTESENDQVEPEPLNESTASWRCKIL